MATLFPEQAVPAKIDPYDPEPEREKIRGRITLLSTVVFGVVLITYLIGAFFTPDVRWARVKDAMQSVLPAVTSILGTVVGFYFGSQKR